MTTRKHKVAVQLPPRISGFVYGVCTAGATAGVVPVKVGGQILKARCPRDLTVSARDVVVMAKVGSSMWILNRYFVAANGKVDIGDAGEPAGPGGTITGTSTFTARKTATYRGSGWRTDSDQVYQGTYGSFSNNTGCAFYGQKITPLAGTTVLAAHIKASRLTGGATGKAQSTLWGVVEGTRPAGAPTLSTTSYTGPYLAAAHLDADIPINTTLAQALVDGTYAGLAVFDPDGDPYLRFAGLHDYPGAFALTISWRRSS